MTSKHVQPENVKLFPVSLLFSFYQTGLSAYFVSNVRAECDCYKTHLIVRRMDVQIIVSPVAKKILEGKKTYRMGTNPVSRSIFSEFLNLLENSFEKFLVHKCGF